LTGLVNYSVSSDLIDRGDVLDVTIVTSLGNVPPTTTPVRVGEDGKAEVPLIGPVALAGLELESAEQAIAAAAVARGIFQRPYITVTMKRKRMNQVMVVGAVKQPGVFSLPANSSSLLAAIVAAGGLSPEAGGELEVRHAVAPAGAPSPLRAPPLQLADGGQAQPASYQSEQPPLPPVAAPVRINLATAAVDGSGGRRLEDGDVVMVAKRAPKPIYVIGLVHKPGEIELPPNQDIRVLDAIALAGERTMQIADDVLVIRQVAGQSEPIVIEVSIHEAKRNGRANLRLAPGDVVSVEDTPLTAAMRVATGLVRFTVGGSMALF